MNYEELKRFIAERGLKQRYIARGMGISDKRMHDLINGGHWKLTEVIAFCSFLKLTRTQRDRIFFATV